VDQQLAAKGEEKNHPLEHSDQPGWESRALKAVARVGQPSEQERNEDN
jgi:hypothetical protein